MYIRGKTFTNKHFDLKKTYLLAIALIAAFGGFLFGYDMGIISGTIIFVKEKYALDTFMEGWFVSSALVGCIFGVAFAGEISDRFGRKLPLALCGLLLCSAAMGAVFCNNELQLIACRLIAGIGIGVASVLSPLYLAEISPAKSRGRLVALYQFAVTLGILSGYLINAYILKLSHAVPLNAGLWYHLIKEDVWRVMLASAAVPAILFFFAMLFVPESPRWAMVKGKSAKAQTILAKIYGKTLAQAEVKRMEFPLTKKMESSWSALFNKKNRLLLFAGILLALLSQFTGINAIIYYGPKIMGQAGLKLSDVLGGQVFIGLVNVLATMVAIWKIDQYGRKNLMIGGVGMMFISLVMIGFLFQTGQTQGFWFIVFMLLFIASFAIGYGSVIWVLLSEIYPTPIRGRAMSAATFSLWIGTAIIGQIVPWMLDVLTPAGTFFIFALCCIPVFLVLKWIPETKGLSLEEIEQSEN